MKVNFLNAETTIFFSKTNNFPSMKPMNIVFYPSWMTESSNTVILIPGIGKSSIRGDGKYVLNIFRHVLMLLYAFGVRNIVRTRKKLKFRQGPNGSLTVFSWITAGKVNAILYLQIYIYIYIYTIYIFTYMYVYAL